ncbi:MAG: EAL domain-containing protein [Halieaceae bacterium]
MLTQLDIQSAIYRSDEALLENLLGPALGDRLISAISVYRSTGERLWATSSLDSIQPPELTLDRLRSDVSPAALHSRVIAGAGITHAPGVWSAIVASGSYVHLTIPVASAINPTAIGVSDLDFAKALLQHKDSKSKIVMGYTHAAISQSSLLSASLRELQLPLATISLSALLIFLAIYIVTRRLAGSLRDLAQLADDVAAGNIDAAVNVEGSSEIKDVARVLNSVIGGFNRRQHEIETGQQLLNLKVAERTSQLSERDSALDKATAEVIAARSKLQHLSHYDTVTSLPNQSLFFEQLDLLLGLGEREQQPLTLLVINLDNLSQLKETFGYVAGDTLLRKIGERITTCVRSSDLVSFNPESGPRIDVARLGGDEFTVVLSRSGDSQSAEDVAERILTSLTDSIEAGSNVLQMIPSIGIASAPADADNREDLLRAATTAMHKARMAVECSIVTYDKSMRVLGGLDKRELLADLQCAIDRVQLTLHYQPQVDAINGSVSGAEALIRWQHPEFGFVPPSVFLPLAEQCGYISVLGDWVLQEAIGQWLRFSGAALNLPRLTINVSAQEFGVDFAARLKVLMQESGVPANVLELGLSERVLQDGGPGTLEALETIKEAGVCLAIDDFGASGSALTYLTQAPIDRLCLDRVFVHGCGDGGAGANLVAGLIALGGKLNMEIVAEGVETMEQYHFLRSCGVGLVQGHLFSEPLPAHEFAKLLSPWHFMAQVQRQLA